MEDRKYKRPEQHEPWCESELECAPKYDRACTCDFKARQAAWQPKRPEEHAPSCPYGLDVERVGIGNPAAGWALVWTCDCTCDLDARRARWDADYRQPNAHPLPQAIVVRRRTS